MIGEEELALALREARSLADHGSFCTRRKVGAVLFDVDGRFLAYGVNRTPVGQRCDEGHCPRGQSTHAELPPDSPGYDQCIAQHAEMTAIELATERLAARMGEPTVQMLSGPQLFRYTTMVVTDEPCHECMPRLKYFQMNVYWPEGKALWST